MVVADRDRPPPSGFVSFFLHGASATVKKLRGKLSRWKKKSGQKSTDKEPYPDRYYLKSDQWQINNNNNNKRKKKEALSTRNYHNKTINNPKMTIASTQPYIAVLNVDIPMFAPGTPAREKYGDYGDQSISLLDQDGVLRSKGIQLKKYQVRLNEEIPTEQDLDTGNLKGILVTGSRADSFSNTEHWYDMLKDFLSKVIARNEAALKQSESVDEEADKSVIPIVGICFGHQVLAKLLDRESSVKLDRNVNGWELGLTHIKVTDEFQQFVQSTLAKLPPSSASSAKNVTEDGQITLIETHQDVAYDVPKGFSLVGSTANTKVQGFFSSKHRILTFQGHPEFNTAFYNEEILPVRVKRGLMSQEEYEKVRAVENSSNQEDTNQGDKIGKVIIGVFLD